ncbi:22110_t:CDS:1, partial [Gigaspora margarita]
QLQVIVQDMLPKNQNIAKWLGLNNQVFAVYLIRNIIETYNKIEYKIIKNIEINKEKGALVNNVEHEQKTTENKKVLLIMEYGDLTMIQKN